jgi:hypothetical protein
MTTIPCSNGFNHAAATGSTEELSRDATDLVSNKQKWSIKYQIVFMYIILHHGRTQENNYFITANPK